MAGASSSLELVFEYARKQYDEQIARRDALVTRSAAMIGFTGVFIGLAADTKYTGAAFHAFSIIGFAVLLVAILLAITVVFLRRFTATPQVDRTVEYWEQPKEDTLKQWLVDTREAIHKNDVTLEHQQWAFQVALGLVALGIALVSLGVVFAIL